MPYFLSNRIIRSSSFFKAARQQLHNVATSPVHSPALTYVAELFATAVHANPSEKRKYDLIKKMVIEEYRKAEWRNAQPKGLFRLIDSIPNDLPLSQKRHMFCERISTDFAMPVITSHPTRIITNAAISRLYDITKAAITLDELPSHSEHLKQTIKTNIFDLIEQPILQTPNLTPQQESDYILFIYQKIIESFPEFAEQVVDQFVQVHGGNTEETLQQVKSSIMDSFRNVFSWEGDADGNDNVTAESMSRTIAGQQVAIIELYKKHVQANIALFIAHSQSASLTGAVAELQELDGFFKRCINSINAGILFDEESSVKTSKRIVRSLTKLRTHLPPDLKKSLTSLIYMIELAGLFGGMKIYVRQTTKVNLGVFDELLHILAVHNQDVRNLISSSSDGIRSYHQLTKSEKIKLHCMLSTNPDLFLIIKKHRTTLSPVAVKELNRLLFLKKNADLFPFYICSDTEDKINFDEVLILLRLASYLDGSLHIGQMHQFPINLLFLCETPKDLAHFPNILSDILHDPHLRERVRKSGFISYVSGPSDLGKTGGIATHISLYRSQMMAENLLNDFKKKYPELSSVKLRVLHGYGGDMKRRIGTAAQQLHSTFQGRDAYDELGAPGAYASYVHRVAGYSSESNYRVEELEQLRKEYPKAYETLLFIENQAVAAFQEFIEKSSSKDLLRALTNPELEKILNTSSRAGSKLSKTDITKARAIGLVNLYLLTGNNWDIFMSLVGWITIPQEMHADLPMLFEKSTVMKDVIYKTLYVIAASDMNRGWRKILDGKVPSAAQIKEWCEEYADPNISDKQLHHTLAYIETSTYSILRALILFMHSSQQDELIEHLERSVQASKKSNEIALELMDRMGGDGQILANETRDLLVDIKELAVLVEEYERNPTKENTINAALSCRAGLIPGGPRSISNFFSPRRSSQNVFDTSVDKNDDGGPSAKTI